MKRAVVHVIGAGVAGLAAARALAASGRCDVVIHEARAQAGGRRRSFRDETLGVEIDIGNFPLLSGWKSSLALVDAIGARGEWVEAKAPGVDFADFAAGKRWRLAPNAGRLPWWLLHERRRGPGLTPADYWGMRRLLSAPADATVAAFAPKGHAFERLWRPLTLAALNCEPEAGSARLAGAALRAALAGGGAGLKLLTPAANFGRAFVEPLTRAVERQGAALRFGRRLTGATFADSRASGLEFETDRLELGPRDGVILAVSWFATATLIPGLEPPSGASSVLTVHFVAQPPRGAPGVVGVVHGAFQWLFCYRDRISVSIRDADKLLAAPRETLAAECWRQAAALTGLTDELPPWRVVASRRATFPATPADVARRPALRTRWANLFLAGGHVSQPAPDSVEASVRSGEQAARAWLSTEG
jgi:hydroxysqualene dehydroxylase